MTKQAKKKAAKKPVAKKPVAKKDEVFLTSQEGETKETLVVDSKGNKAGEIQDFIEQEDLSKDYEELDVIAGLDVDGETVLLEDNGDISEVTADELIEIEDKVDTLEEDKKDLSDDAKVLYKQIKTIEMNLKGGVASHKKILESKLKELKDRLESIK